MDLKKLSLETVKSFLNDPIKAGFKNKNLKIMKKKYL